MSKQSESEIQKEFFAALAKANLYGFEIGLKWIDEGGSLGSRSAGGVLRDKYGPGLSEGHPLMWVHSIPNGGSRGGTEAQRKKNGGLMKAEGVKKGVADVYIPASRQNHHGFYIEFKTTKGKQSKEQEDFAKHCLNEQYLYAVSTSAKDALSKVAWYFGYKEKEGI